MEQMHHRRLQIEFSGNCFCGYVCIVCRIFPTTFCLLYTYLSLKTKNAEILVYHSKKKTNIFFFIYVYSFTQINWQEKINFSYGFMIIKSDIFYSFGNSRSTLPYFFLTESLNQAYKRFQNILPVVVLRLFSHSYAKISECMKFRHRSIYVNIEKRVWSKKRWKRQHDWAYRSNNVICITWNIKYCFTYSMLIMILRNTKFLALIFSTHTTVVHVSII